MSKLTAHRIVLIFSTGLLQFKMAEAAPVLSLNTNSSMVSATPGRQSIVPAGLGVGLGFSLNNSSLINLSYDLLIGKEHLALIHGGSASYVWYLTGSLSNLASHSLLNIESAPINSWTLSAGVSVKKFNFSSVGGVDTRFIDVTEKKYASETVAGLTAGLGYEFLATPGFRIGPKIESFFPVSGHIKVQTHTFQVRATVEL